MHDDTRKLQGIGIFPASDRLALRRTSVELAATSRGYAPPAVDSPLQPRGVRVARVTDGGVFNAIDLDGTFGGAAGDRAGRDVVGAERAGALREGDQAADRAEKPGYASAQPLGTGGFVLNDVVAVIPANPATGDKESTVKIQKVTVEELDFDRMKDAKDDEAPRFAKLKIEGMTGDDEMFTALQPYGVPNVPFDIALDYRLDGRPSASPQQARDRHARPGQGRASLVIDGISDKSSEVAGAKDDGKLRSASLMIDDSGLLAKLLPPLAKEQGQTAEGMVGVALVYARGLRRGAGRRDPEGARRRGLLHRRLAGAQGSAGAGAEAGQDRGHLRPRQDHAARRAHRRVRLHRHLPRHQGGRGEGRREPPNEAPDPARRRPALPAAARPGLAQDSFSHAADPDDRAVPAGRRRRHHRPAGGPW